MRTRSLTLAMPLLLTLTCATVAQTPTAAPALGTGARGGSSCTTFVEFEMADRTGPILLDPSLVSSVQPSGEKPKASSFVKWRDGQVTVEGTVEQVTKKLGRAP